MAILKQARCLATIAALGCISFAWPVAAEGLSIFGLWATPENRSHIDIQVCDYDATMLCGRVAWQLVPLDQDGNVLLDEKNDDPALRQRALLGIDILWLGPDENENSWSGRVYDPESGNTYRARVALKEEGALRFKGCFLIFCQSQSWPRVSAETSTVQKRQP